MLPSGYGDITWVVTCGVLVLIMQAGFTCLEGGLVRAKNSINVAIKNVIDFCVAATLFAAFGYGLMFGASEAGLIGTDRFAPDHWSTPGEAAFFFFQAMFCGTATTILSGAVAERMRFVGYFAGAALLAALIYPVVGHWAWNGVDLGQANGWLGALGFIDFAGSTVVHSVGGWTALAALLVIGPRVGRFGPGGRPIEGDDLPTATLGAFLLWFGWFGFNGGSTLAFNDAVPSIITVTALGGAAGGLAALGSSWWLFGRPLADRILNGVLGGLVAITAGCHLMGPFPALLVGAVGGAIAVVSTLMLERVKIDDAVGAVPVHLFAGIWGTLAVALFGPMEAMAGGSRLQQLGIQALGIATVGAYTFIVAYVGLRLIDKVMRLRVTEAEERIGLNLVEHAAGGALLDLLTQMEAHARSGQLVQPVAVEPATEAHRIAVLYNAVIEEFGREQRRLLAVQDHLNTLSLTDPLTTVYNRRGILDELDRALAQSTRSRLPGALLYVDLDWFKPINDRMGHEVGDAVLQEVARRLRSGVRRTDSVGRLGGDEFAVVLRDLQNDEDAEEIATKLDEALKQPIEAAGATIRMTGSIGVAKFGPLLGQKDVIGLLREADNAMYRVKLARGPKPLRPVG